MNVVAHAGAIGRWVVRSEDGCMRRASKGHLQNPRDEMSFRLMCLALVRIRRAGCIEVSQRSVAQAVDLMEPRQHALYEQLRFAIGVGRMDGIVLFNRNAIGIPEERSRRGEYKPGYLRA